MDRKPLCSTRGNRGGGSATASGGGRSPPIRDGRVARDSPPRRRARRLRGDGVGAHRKKRGRTWNVFSVGGRHAGRVGRERGVEGGGQHGARGTLCEARGAFDARNPAGIARGTRSSNVLNIPPTKCPERSGPLNISSSPRSFTPVCRRRIGTRPIHTHETLETSSTTRAAPHPCARLVHDSSGGRAKTRRKESSFVPF
jgi:hypothetical protein